MLLWMLGLNPVMNLDASGLAGFIVLPFQVIEHVLTLGVYFVAAHEGLTDYRSSSKLPAGAMRKHGMIDAAFWLGLSAVWLLLGATVTLVIIVALVLAVATYFRIDRAIKVYLSNRERIRQLNRESWVQRQEG